VQVRPEGSKTLVSSSFVLFVLSRFN